MKVKLNRRLTALLLTIVASFCSVNAAEKKQACLQSPKRQNACPNLLYKAIPFKDEGMKLVCICLTDFEAFLSPSQDSQKAALQKLERQDLTISLGMSEQEILELLKR